MSEYGSMQVSEGININKTNASKQWFIQAILMCICVYISVCLFVCFVSGLLKFTCGSIYCNKN